MSRSVSWVFKTGLIAVFVLLALGLASSAQAAPPLPTPTPPPERGCRGCHGATSRTLTFASGEVVPVEVDLSALDASPHTMASMNEPVACLGCHGDEINHRYPHVAIKETTRRDYALRVSRRCEDCHYAHKPFHAPDPGEGDEALAESAPVDESLFPACVDCHGNHAIARVKEIGTAMPPLCLACHSDETVEWAEEYVAPRPGFGQGAPGYAGSTRCNGCHDDKYFTWQQTLHARLIQNPRKRPSAVAGDFAHRDPGLTFTIEEVAFTIGSRWKQVYVSQPMTGTFTILPAQWNVAAGEWVPYQSTEGGAGSDWLTACGSCHVTGLQTEAEAAEWSFTEFGVGCESCHGPSAEHASDPENVKPFAKADSQVCGACHSRGVSPEGHPFAATFRPGEALADHFAASDSAEVRWPDGSARLNHDQYRDWTLGNTMAEEPSFSCATCHEVHGPGVDAGQLRKPVNELCLECHSEKSSLIAHMPYHEQATQTYDFSCSDCHMPKVATSVTPFDIHSHSFQHPEPERSIEYGGADVMPNACNTCHTDYGESPEWAAQMIEWAAAAGGATQPGFFGPGPTPTSPPPPTPIPSAGEAPEEIATRRPGRWLRILFFAGSGILAASVLFLIVRTLVNRRRSHV